jgi:hypothetical protein
LLSAALLAATSGGGASTSVSSIEVKERASANASLAAHGRYAAIVWGASTKDGVTDIYLVTSRDGGRAFTAPLRVNTQAGAANLSGEQPPRIVLLPRAGHDPAVVVVWTAKSPSGTRLWSTRSDDGGKSFASPALVAGSDAPGNRGWESITASPDGNVAALWLDHRDLSTNNGAGETTAHSQHKHDSGGPQKDGVGRAQLSKLFFGRLGEPADARPVTGGVCYCCKTALAAGSNGALYAAWRHVYPGSIRDIAFAMSKDGGRTFSTPVRVSDDNWVLDGCPENGPALAIDARQHIHVVWPTLVSSATGTGQQTLALYYATSSDGQHFTPRQRIPTDGAARHPQLAVGSRGDIVVAWDEQLGGTRRVAWARGTVESSGITRFERQVVADAVPASYPVIGSVDDATILAWTSGSSGQSVIRVDRLQR